MILALVGLLLGLGLMTKWLPVPKILPKILAVLSALVLAVMLWNLLGLPAVEMLNKFTENAWVYALALGYLVGETIGDLMFWRG